MGQNFAGWCRLRVQGESGQTITLRHAEVLNPDGTIYTENLRSAGATEIATRCVAAALRSTSRASRTTASATWR